MVALGREECMLELMVPRWNLGRATLVANHRDDGERCEVSVRRLSDYTEAFKGKRIRLMKIDVEGFESEVLTGAGEFFADNPPDAVLFETNMEYGIANQTEVFQILHDAGYAFFAIPKCLFKTRLVVLDPGSASVSPTNDLLAARRGSVYEEIALLVGA